MLGPDTFILISAVLLLAGVLLSKTSSRLGVPSLLLFLVLGMLAGSEGLLGIEFEDFELAQRYGVAALAFILFSGGAGTAWRDIRRVLVPGIALATVAVLLSALVLGAIAAAIFDLPRVTAAARAARRARRSRTPGRRGSRARGRERSPPAVGWTSRSGRCQAIIVLRNWRVKAAVREGFARRASICRQHNRSVEFDQRVTRWAALMRRTFPPPPYGLRRGLAVALRATAGGFDVL